MIVLLLQLLGSARACPAACTCTADPEYEDGAIVNCQNIGTDTIPFDIPGHVSTLLLSYNNIRNIEEVSFYNNLRALELQHNYISELRPDMFQNLPYLKILVLSENLIERIPDRVFRGLIYLEWVDLRGNKISSVSMTAFYKANNINYLNLVDNRITNIEDGTLLPLTSHNLWLMLGNNSLTELPRDISRMMGLQYLSLSYNKLTYIPPHSLSNNINLQTLDVSHNDISYLHRGTFSGISLLKLDGKGNPWQCDCYLEWLRLYLLSHHVDHTLVCNGPGEMADTKITRITSPLLCTKPVVAAPEPEKRVVEYRNVTLLCLVTGDPVPVVHWYKDGELLHPQANRRKEVSGSEYRLVFMSVMYTDAGVYRCSADNARDPVTDATVTLDVWYIPKIYNSYKWSPTDQEDLNDVTLACNVASNPPLSQPITWTCNDREVTGQEDGVKITRTNLGSTIYLTHHPNVDHSGQYSCIAVNSLGQTRENFHVTQNDMLMLKSSAPSTRITAGSYPHHHLPPLVFTLLTLLFT